MAIITLLVLVCGVLSFTPNTLAMIAKDTSLFFNKKSEERSEKHKNELSISPFSLSVLMGHENAIKEYSNPKFFINQGDRYGNTPLHIAAIIGSDNIVAYLLYMGASPYIKNKSDQTPLDLAQMGLCCKIRPTLQQSFVSSPNAYKEPYELKTYPLNKEDRRTFFAYMCCPAYVTYKTDFLLPSIETYEYITRYLTEYTRHELHNTRPNTARFLKILKEKSTHNNPQAPNIDREPRCCCSCIYAIFRHLTWTIAQSINGYDHELFEQDEEKNKIKKQI